MHEENFLSSWLREDAEGTSEEIENLTRMPKEKGKREVEGGGQGSR